MSTAASTGRAAFVPFVVAGYPSFDVCAKTIDVLVEEGADCLELGVPFSDAMADGPVIQAASEHASKSVRSIETVLEFARATRARHPRLQLVLFTYYNPVLSAGAEFAARARDAGIDAVLVVDLPPEEAADHLRATRAAGLKTVFLASPTTSPDRLALINEASTGFVYYVSRIGVTGVQAELSSTLAAELVELRRRIDRPVAVGFGISTGAQAEAVAGFAQAVVVGSAFVRLMGPDRTESQIVEAVRALARDVVGGLERARGRGTTAVPTAIPLKDPQTQQFRLL